MTRGHFTKAQIKRLLRPVPQDRIEAKQGKAYIPQHEARAELIRIFGPGGADHTMTEPKMLYETKLTKDDDQFPKTGKANVYWVTGYLVGCTMRVYDYEGNLAYECTEWHAEENAPLPNRGEAHAMAVTSAQSYALRRSLISLGDAFGLHLYDGGQAKPLIKGTLALAMDPDAPLFTPEAEREPSVSPSAAETVMGGFKNDRQAS